MMSAQQAAMAAKTVLPGSPEHAIACELCVFRGFKPDDPVTSVALGVSVSNWQWIIAEQILEQQMRIVLARGAKGAAMPLHLNG